MDNSSLHYYIMQHLVDVGRAPRIKELSMHFNQSYEAVVRALKALQDYHGVVLQPTTSEVWVMHPFSNAPTNFWIEAKDNSGSWWGNCAWCSLGAAALLDRDVTITTTLGAESEQIIVEIVDGQIKPEHLFVHFPIPMQNAWDNVTYTCSTMLLFDAMQSVSDWCQRHGIPRGDVQPVDKIWQFSKVWYGNHLNPDWKKWTVDEARAIFTQFGLVDSIWDMPSDTGRF